MNNNEKEFEYTRHVMENVNFLQKRIDDQLEQVELLKKALNEQKHNLKYREEYFGFSVGDKVYCMGNPIGCYYCGIIKSIEVNGTYNQFVLTDCYEYDFNVSNCSPSKHGKLGRDLDQIYKHFSIIKDEWLRKISKFEDEIHQMMEAKE